MNWADYFYYDETSPSFLRWAVDIVAGKGRILVAAGDVAGTDRGQGRYKVQLHGQKYQVHRIIWELYFGAIPPRLVVDHEDGNSLNNRLDNLRIVTQAINRRNSRKRIDSGEVQGVCFVERDGRGSWTAKWSELTGKQVKRSFSVGKYGVEGAKTLAIECRERAIERLKSEGAGYTERHGNE